MFALGMKIFFAMIHLSHSHGYYIIQQKDPLSSFLWGMINAKGFEFVRVHLGHIVSWGVPKTVGTGSKKTGC